MKSALLFIVLIAGCSAAFAAVSAPILTSAGLGDAAIGMRVDKLQQALHAKLPYDPYANNGCSLITTPAMEPRGITYVIENKVLTRINLEFYGSDPRSLEIKTDAGVGLGSAEEDVTKAYGSRVRLKPNPADPAWHSLYVDEPDKSRGIIFETDGKTVKSVRAGAYPSISSQTACN